VSAGRLPCLGSFVLVFYVGTVCLLFGFPFNIDRPLTLVILTNSVADPGCLSRIPDPDFYPSRIPDPKTATEEGGEKKFVIKLFFVFTNFTKMNIILFFNAEEKNLGQCSKNYRTFYPKICH
jgi:hypothetical protein